MSHLGLKILYSLINQDESCYAERVYAPWVDFEEIMRKYHIPLYSLETKSPLKEFDVLGFSLQYELSYTNILNMLDLAGSIPWRKTGATTTPLSRREVHAPSTRNPFRILWTCSSWAKGKKL